MRDPLRFLVVKPVRSIRERKQLSLGAIGQAFASHFRHQEIVALTPQNPSGNAYGPIRELGAIADSRAIPIDHRRERSWLRPCGAILGQVLRGKSAGAAGAAESSRPHSEVKSREKCFG